MRSRNILFTTIIVLACALPLYLWLRSGSEADQRAARPNSKRTRPAAHTISKAKSPSSSSGNSKSADTSSFAATAPSNPIQKTSTSSSGPSGSNPRGPASRDMLSFLERWSGTRDWTIHRDTEGRPFKIGGAKLQGAMTSPSQEQTFVSGFIEQVGFEQEPVLTRKEDSGVRDTRLIDYHQSYSQPEGSEAIPVYDAWVRFVADGKGDVFLVTSQLRPIDSDVKTDVTLSDEEAIEIARVHIDEDKAVFEVRSPRMIHAESRPHQLVTQVVMTGINPHKLLLVGHASRAVIDETLLSLH